MNSNFRKWCKKHADNYLPFLDRYRRGRTVDALNFPQIDASRLHAVARAKKIFQPTTEQEQSFSRTITTTEPTKRGKLIIDGLPYSWYPYVSGGDNTRFLHPGVLGRHLLELANNKELAQNYLEKTKSVSVKLPNGGRAFYYPRSIQIARLLGPDLVYSGMTAGDVLGAYVAVIQNFPEAISWCDPKEAFRALTFPWEEGGVNLANCALLELPLFRSAPEVVLNGWLHSLLFLNDYVSTSLDSEAHDFLQQNLLFLSKTLSEYDDEELRLSRYSDVSPYRVSLNSGAKTHPMFHIYYQAKHDELDDLAHPLRFLDNPSGRASVYDNQLLGLSHSGAHLSATLTSSSKYETIIISSSGEFSLTIDPGKHDWLATTPGISGQRIKLNSAPMSVDNLHSINLSQSGIPLMSGCATSFTKSGSENYYHMQHVVALLYLAKVCVIPNEVKDVLLHYSDKWFTYAQRNDLPEGLSFATPESVFAALHRGKPIKCFENFAELVAS